MHYCKTDNKRMHQAETKADIKADWKEKGMRNNRHSGNYFNQNMQTKRITQFAGYSST